MQKLIIIIGVLVATSLARPADRIIAEDFGFQVYDIPLAEIDTSAVAEKRETSDSDAADISAIIDEGDLARIKAVNDLAETSRNTRSINETDHKLPRITLKEIYGRSAQG